MCTHSVFIIRSNDRILTNCTIFLYFRLVRCDWLNWDSRSWACWSPRKWRPFIRWICPWVESQRGCGTRWWGWYLDFCKSGFILMTFHFDSIFLGYSILLSYRWYNDVGDVNSLEFKNLRLKNLLKTDLCGELKWLR